MSRSRRHNAKSSIVEGIGSIETLATVSPMQVAAKLDRCRAIKVGDPPEGLSMVSGSTRDVVENALVDAR